MNTDFLNRTQVRVHVYRLPYNLNTGYCFNDDQSIAFTNVDWFDADPEDRPALEAFIKSKRYYLSHRRYLVLADDPRLTFTIDPSKDPNKEQKLAEPKPV